MKRILTPLLAMLMLCSLVTACGSGGGEASPSAAATSNSSADARQTSSVAPPAESSEFMYPMEGGPALSVWYAIRADFVEPMGGDYADMMGQAALEEATGVTIEWMNPSYLVATENLAVLLASNDYPDIFVEVQGFYTGGLTGLYNEGISVDLTDYLEAYMPNYYETINTLYNVKDTVTDDGRALSIFSPNLIGMPTTCGPIIRYDWLEDLNLTVPETYDDYYNMLMAFKTEKGAAAPMWVSTAGVPQFNYLAAGYGVAAFTNTRTNAFYQVDGEVKFGPVEDGWTDFMSMMADWYSNGLIYKDFLTQDNEMFAPIQMLANGESGLVHGMSFVFANATNLSDEPGFNVQPIRDAVQYSGQKLHLMRETTLIEKNGTIITTDCEDIETACRWLDYMFTEEGIYLSNWGIEGLSYDMVDGAPVLTEAITNNPYGYTNSGMLMRYRLLLPSIVDWHVDTTQEIQYVASDVWNEISDFTYSLPASMTMTEDESAEYANLYGDIQTIVLEYTCGLIMGERSLSEYDKFVQDLNNLGIGRCIEIQQAALNRYNAR